MTAYEKVFIPYYIMCGFAGCKGSQQKGNTAESNGKESVANSDGKPAVTVTIPPYKFSLIRLPEIRWMST